MSTLVGPLLECFDSNPVDLFVNLRQAQHQLQLFLEMFRRRRDVWADVSTVRESLAARVVNHCRQTAHTRTGESFQFSDDVRALQPRQQVTIGAPFPAFVARQNLLHAVSAKAQRPIGFACHILHFNIEGVIANVRVGAGEAAHLVDVRN